MDIMIDRYNGFCLFVCFKTSKMWLVLVFVMDLH